MGQTATPLVLDTGSSDLWVVSDACTESVCQPLTLYPQASFKSANLDARLFYGDSTTGTFASGEIGKDIVGVAGLSIENQFFAAINNTNTTVLQTGSAGILGMGFPVNRYMIVLSPSFRSIDPLSQCNMGSIVQIAVSHRFSAACKTIQLEYASIS
jgi:Eukaryotic aspartyl protease